MIAAVARRRSLVTASLLLVFALLACARMPDILRTGRFWAEEGRYFFEDAWVLPPGRALLITVGGYLNLVANAATLAARWLMPLVLAPYLTIAVALLVQLVPPLLLLTARDSWLQPLPVRVAATAALLFAPSSDEIWLQTLHCQFELTLASAIVLVLETGAAPAIGLLRLLVLLLAPLCGPGAVVLLPLFVLRLLVDREPARLLQLAVAAAAATTQVLLFYRPGATRSFTLTPDVFATILYVRHLVLPFEGVPRAAAVATVLRAELAAGHRSHLALLAPILAAGGAAAVALRGPASRPAFWFLLSGLCVAALSYLGAIGNAVQLIDARFGERYAFVPGALFSLALLVLAATARGLLAVLGWMLLCWQLVIGADGFFHPWPFLAHGPGWRDEVSAWRVDPAHRLRTWPDGWTMMLDPLHRAQDH